MGIRVVNGAWSLGSGEWKIKIAMPWYNMKNKLKTLKI